MLRHLLHAMACAGARKTRGERSVPMHARTAKDAPKVTL
jgi:hypothetical protein